MSIRRAALCLAAAGIVALPAAAVAAEGPRGGDPALCGHHVGGVSVTTFTTDYRGGCTLLGPGTFTVAAGGVASITKVYLRGGLTFRNEGAATFLRCVDISLKINAGTTFENASTLSTQICGDYVDGDGALHNEAGAIFNIGRDTTVRPYLVNDGTIVATGGHPVLERLTNLADGTLTGGEYRLQHTTLQLSGAVTTNAAQLLIGPRSRLVTSNTDALATLAENTGVLEIDTDQSTGALRNDGTLTLGSGAVVRPSGAATLASDGELHVALDHSGPGSIQANGPLSVGGALVLEPGAEFRPAPGHTFTIATSQVGITGAFSSVSGLQLTPDEYLDLHYLSNAITLTVETTSPPQPLTVTGVTPDGIGRGDTDRALTITGTGFAPDALVGFESSDVLATSTTYVDSETLSVHASASTTAALGARGVRVRDPSLRTAAGCSRCLIVQRRPTAPQVSHRRYG